MEDEIDAATATVDVEDTRVTPPRIFCRSPVSGSGFGRSGKLCTPI